MEALQQVSESVSTSVTPLTASCPPFVPMYNGLAMSKCEGCYSCVITSLVCQGAMVCSYMGVFKFWGNSFLEQPNNLPY
jgi:hypothetical protein